jgi:hypothetical protein
MDDVEPIWIDIRERAKDDVINDAEDRRIRPDANRQRQYRGDRKRRRAPQALNGVAKIVEDAIHQRASISRRLPENAR